MCFHAKCFYSYIPEKVQNADVVSAIKLRSYLA